MFKRKLLALTLLVVGVFGVKMFFSTPAFSATCPLTVNRPYKVSGSPTIYYITPTCTKQVVLNTKTYYSWFASFSAVRTTNASTLNSIPYSSVKYLPLKGTTSSTPASGASSPSTQTPSTQTSPTTQTPNTPTTATTPTTPTTVSSGGAFTYVYAENLSVNASGIGNLIVDNIKAPAGSTDTLDVTVDDQVSNNWANSSMGSRPTCSLGSGKCGTVGKALCSGSPISTCSIPYTAPACTKTTCEFRFRATSHLNSKVGDLGFITVSGQGTEAPPSTPGTCTSFNYSNWSACADGIQTRTIISSSPNGCSGGSPKLIQDCSVTTNPPTNPPTDTTNPPTTGTSPVISSFTASPSSIVQGGSSLLSWSTSGATTLSINGIGAVTGSSITVNPSQSTSYTLTASNSYGSATAQTSVVVSSGQTSGTVAAFPGAQGAGAITQGGRASNSKVYVVTSLDGGNGPGTLGECITATGPRYCVFAVSGVINTASGYGIQKANSNITILGQTAPGKGITVVCPAASYACFNVDGDNVVIQYLRVRHLTYTGSGDTGSTENITPWHGVNQIFDHISMSWAQNDSFGLSRGEPINNTTESWLLMSDGMVEHNTALITSFLTDDMANSSGPLDLHHSIVIANHRQPRYGVPTFRMVNNLLYPLSGDSKGASDFSGGMSADVIGNIFKNTSQRPYAISLETWQDYRDGGSEDHYPSVNSGNPSIYTYGNLGKNLTGSESATNQYNGLVFHAGGVNSDFSSCVYNCPPAHADSKWMRTSPLSTLKLPITADTANSSLESKLWAEAGASRRIDGNGAWTSAQDLFDQGVYSRYQNGTLFEPTSENDSRYSNNGWNATKTDIANNANTGKWTSTMIPGISDTWVTYWRSVGNGHPTNALDQAPWNNGYNALDIFASGYCPSNTGMSVQACSAALFGGAGTGTSNQSCTNFYYSDWSACSNGTQTRTVVNTSPAGCVGGNPIVSQTCGSGNVNVTINGQGTVTCNGGSCSGNFTQGSVVNLVATPASGSAFSSWGGACSGIDGNTCGLTVGSSNNVTANFTGGSNNNTGSASTPYTGTAVSVPGTIQAENFDNGGEGVAYHNIAAGVTATYRPSEAVETLSCTDGSTSCGTRIGYSFAGEWYGYTINVTAAGSYTIQIRYATPEASQTVHFELDGTRVGGTISLPTTGSWTTYATVTSPSINFTSGKHFLKLVADTSSSDFDYFTIGTATVNTCTSFTYSAWGACTGTQTRTVTSQSPSGCTGGSPVLSQSCTPSSDTSVTPLSGAPGTGGTKGPTYLCTGSASTCIGKSVTGGNGNGCTVASGCASNGTTDAQLIASGYNVVTQGGLVPDCQTDNSAKLNAAMNAAAPGQALYFPATPAGGCYLINPSSVSAATPIVTVTHSMIGQVGAWPKIQVKGASMATAAQGDHELFRIGRTNTTHSTTPIIISGLYLDGGETGMTDGGGYGHGYRGDAWDAAIFINNSYNVTIRNNFIEHFFGSAVLLAASAGANGAGPSNVIIDNNTIEWNEWPYIDWAGTGAEEEPGTVITNNILSQDFGSSGGMDAESDPGTEQTWNVEIAYNSISQYPANSGVNNYIISAGFSSNHVGGNLFFHNNTANMSTGHHGYCGSTIAGGGVCAFYQNNSPSSYRNVIVKDNDGATPATPSSGGSTCTSFTYSGWGVCQSNNTQTRTITSQSPSGCTGGAPVTSQICSYTPPASGTYPVNVTITGQGTVTCNNGSCSGSFTQGSVVALIATPASGSTFSSWGGACSGIDGNTCNLTIGTNNNVSATFTSGTTPPPSGSGSTPYTGTAISVPGTIQAENFDNGGEGVAYHNIAAGVTATYRPSEAVETLSCTDGSTSCGTRIGYSFAGEWYGYTINVTSAGSYTIQIRYATPEASQTVHFELDGTRVGGTVSLPTTGSWTTYNTVVSPSINFTSGKHFLKLVADTSSSDFDYFTIGTSGTVTPPASGNTSFTSATASGISSSGATISWNVSPASKGQVQYGPTTNYGSLSTLEVNPLSYHSQVLSGLSPNTTYHYRVTNGASDYSADGTFTTTGGSSVGTCTSFTYTAWGTCTNKVQTRNIASASPAGCTGGSPVLSQSCTVANQVKAPVISPPSGNYTGSSLAIQINDETTGASGIMASYDGSNNFSAYGGVDLWSIPRTVKAFARQSGMADSDIVTAVYTTGSGYPLNLTLTGNGTVTCNGGRCDLGFDLGTSVKMVAAAAAQWALDKDPWGGACAGITGNTCTLTIGTSNNVTVKFVYSPTPTTCTSFTYSDWSTCSNNTQTRTVLSSSPSGCTGGSPVTSQTCGSSTNPPPVSGNAPGSGTHNPPKYICQAGTGSCASGQQTITGGGSRPSCPGSNCIDVTAAPYNAKGDGVTDDSAAFRAATAAAGSSRAVYVPAPPGGQFYKITPRGGDANQASIPVMSSIVAAPGVYPKIKMVGSIGHNDAGGIFQIEVSSVPIVIAGLDLDGGANLSTVHGFDGSDTEKLWAWDAGITIIKSHNISIVDNFIHDNRGDGVYIDDAQTADNNAKSNNILIDSNTIQHNGRQEVTVNSVSPNKPGVAVINNSIESTWGYGSVLDVEPNGGKYQGCPQCSVWNFEFAYNKLSQPSGTVANFDTGYGGVAGSGGYIYSHDNTAGKYGFGSGYCYKTPPYPGSSSVADAAAGRYISWNPVFSPISVCQSPGN